MTPTRQPPAGPTEAPLQDPKELLGPPAAGSLTDVLGVLRTMAGALMRIESPPWSVATMDPEALCRWMQRQAALAVQIGGPAIAEFASDEPRRDPDSASDSSPMEGLKDLERAATPRPPRAHELLKRGGEWLGAARSWIQWHCRNGSEVDWGSQAVLVPSLTVRDVEEIAAEAVAAFLAAQRPPKALASPASTSAVPATQMGAAAPHPCGGPDCVRACTPFAHLEVRMQEGNAARPGTTDHDSSCSCRAAPAAPAAVPALPSGARPETDSRAASAASPDPAPSVSAEDEPEPECSLCGTPVNLGERERSDPLLCDPCAQDEVVRLRAAEAAAYARGLADAATEAERRFCPELAERIRALSGSAATAAQPPSKDPGNLKETP